MQQSHDRGIQVVPKRLLPLLAGLLVLTSVLLQVADTQVSQFDDDLAKRDRKIDNMLANQLQVNLMLLRWNLTEASGSQFAGMDPHLLLSDAAKAIYDPLRERFKNGEISSQQYAHQMVEFYGAQYVQLDKWYNTEGREYARLQRLGTPWRFWKRAFTLLSIILAVASLVLTSFMQRTERPQNSAEPSPPADPEGRADAPSGSAEA